MRPNNLKTKIFLDSGDPKETQEILSLLGFLDGQTTNPTLIAKNPQAKAQLDAGKKFTKQEIYDFYKSVVTEISSLIPNGSVSIEVYADHTTSSDKMIQEGREMNTWIPNAHIKLPTTSAGLQAAETLAKENIKVNMTLCFTQDQAAAVYAATSGSSEGTHFVSPFIGRLDDIGLNGMDLIKNCVQMYKESDHHVQVLAASIRTLTQLMECFHIGADIVTVPYKVLKEWGEQGMPIAFRYAPRTELKPIEYKSPDLSQSWDSFDIKHELTDKGIEKFAADWNQLLS